MQHRNRYWRVVGAGLLALLLIAGCTAPLYQGLAEEDANELVTVLEQSGVPADKQRVESTDGATWTVVVKARLAEDARRILRDNNLPRQKITTSEDIFSKNKAMIPTQSEERNRERLAKQGDIAKTIMNTVPDVVAAKVELAIPEPDPLCASETPAQPKASVWLRYRAAEFGGPSFDVKLIARAVADSVPGLDAANVTVVPIPVAGYERMNKRDDPRSAATQPIDWETFGPIKVASESVGVFKAFLLAVMALFAAMAIVLLMSTLRLQKTSQQNQRTQALMPISNQQQQGNP